MVRAGESEYESLGIINTNPVAKTSMDNGLSEIGKKQTVRAALNLKSMGACDNSCWIWPSITQRAYQAAEIIAAVNGVTRRYIRLVVPSINCSFFLFWFTIIDNLKLNALLVSKSCYCIICSRIVPEYSFLDARGLGAYEGKKLDSVSEVIELNL